MHLAGEDRAEARLVDAAQLLHDRRRQSDFVADNGAAAARDRDVLECLPDCVGLVEIARQEVGGQNVDWLPSRNSAAMVSAFAGYQVGQRPLLIQELRIRGGRLIARG